MKKEYEDKTDAIELMQWVSENVPVWGNKKLKFTNHGVYNLLQHPHKLVRWLTVIYSNKRFIPIIEYHYYKEKKEVVRAEIIKRARNINLVVYALINEDNDKLKKMAFIRYAHLIGGNNEKNVGIGSTD